MRALAQNVLDALAFGTVGLVQLVHLEFSTGTLSLNGSNFDLTWGGVVYRGAAGFGSIVPVHDAPGEIQGVQLEINGGPSTFISLALDEVDVVQGAKVTIRTAILSGEPLTIYDAPIDWVGFADTMNITETGERCSIQLTAESKAVTLLRGTPLTTSDADQKSIDPTDRAFEYIVDQAKKPLVWPKREWFLQ